MSAFVDLFAAAVCFLICLIACLLFLRSLLYAFAVWVFGFVLLFALGACFCFASILWFAAAWLYFRLVCFEVVVVCYFGLPVFFVDLVTCCSLLWI